MGWANNEDVGSGDVFETLHSGLTVRLIATPRAEWMTCSADEALRDAMERNREPYDFLPVIGMDQNGVEGIVGLLHTVPFQTKSSFSGNVREHFAPLSEEHLIGANTSILDFVKDADKRLCRFVVSGANIVGLVSLSDLQRLPVRAALFALITGLEITMLEAIRQKCSEESEWLAYLSEGRKRKVADQIAASRSDNSIVDTLLFTQFCDKADIVVEALPLPLSKTALRKQLKEIQELRDNLAHANEYAASACQARRVCAVVRDLLMIRKGIAAASNASNNQRPSGS